MKETAMEFLFISYSRQDVTYARKLADALLERGFDVWIDNKQIEYGANWEKEIFRSIDQCAAFIVLMSPASSDSTWVQRECHHAEKRNKPPFPILLEGEEFPRYGLTQYVQVRQNELPPEEFFARLAQLVSRKNQPGSERAPVIADEPSVPSIEPAPARNLGQFAFIPNRPISDEIRQLLARLDDPALQPFERAKLGQDLDQKGDPRRGIGKRQDDLPDIEWVKIPAGPFHYQSDQRLTLPPYFISRYPITYAQYRLFLNDDDGYSQSKWWQGLAARQEKPGQQEVRHDNHPADNLSWYDAAAFCRWLGTKLHYTVRLPTDAEWEKAARGTDGRLYPWGPEFKSGFSNVMEQRENGVLAVYQTTAVGIFPHGVSPYGLFDMSGNVWEWCASLFDAPDQDDPESPDLRVLRGGSWFNPQSAAETTYRTSGDPDGRSSLVGFRVVRPAPNG